MKQKPWPGDAVIIVAANSGQENRANMESVVDVYCRDCFAPLAADAKTIRLAEQTPARRGRPIEFFCCRCAIRYNPGSITHYADQSASQDGRKAIISSNPSAIDIEKGNQQ